MFNADVQYSITYYNWSLGTQTPTCKKTYRHQSRYSNHQRWLKLNRARGGGTCSPTFTYDWEMGALWVQVQQTRKWPMYWHHKSAYQTNNCRAKNGGKDKNFFPALRAGCAPHLWIHSGVSAHKTLFTLIENDWSKRYGTEDSITNRKSEPLPK